MFTHCGSGLVRSKARSVDALVHSLGRERGIDARVAYDGLTMIVRDLTNQGLMTTGPGPCRDGSPRVDRLPSLGVWHIIPPREDSPPFCRNPLEIRHDHREELRISLIACWYRPCQLHG